jgi:formamidopyrimidine-DNA glycosylase
MPELPEVETVVRDLRPLLVGRRIAAVRAGKQRLRRAWADDWNEVVTGRRVRGVSRRGKWIVAELDSGHMLVFHLGMTGQLRVWRAADPTEAHTHLVFPLDRGRDELRFRDVRRFGSATLFGDAAAWNAFIEEGKLGPEPFDLSASYWRETLAKTHRPLKAVLLDQRVVAGVGNIYADETLFAARLDPRRRGHDLTRAEADRLQKAIARVLTLAIEARGSTIRDYVGGSGLRGGYQERFFVYGRTAESCRKCGRAVERIRLAGRSTHYCPKCQQ